MDTLIQATIHLCHMTAVAQLCVRKNVHLSYDVVVDSRFYRFIERFLLPSKKAPDTVAVRISAQLVTSV